MAAGAGLRPAAAGRRSCCGALWGRRPPPAAVRCGQGRVLLLVPLPRRHVGRRWAAAGPPPGGDGTPGNDLNEAWKRVNPPGPLGGPRSYVEPMDEAPYRKGFAEGSRGPAGTGHEPPWPTYASYPRMEKDQDPLERRALTDETKRISQWGGVGLLIACSMVAAVLFYIIDAGWVRRDQYFVPNAVYLHTDWQKRLRITHVVFLDVALNGTPVGRIHIGLFDREAPHFCENFHRLCTAQSPSGETLKGSLFWKYTGWNLYGGDYRGVDGLDGKVVTPEFEKDGFLPEDLHNNLHWPFACYTGGAFTYHENHFNSSHFLIGIGEQEPVTHGDWTMFGMVLKGYDVVENIAHAPREPHPYFIDRIEVTGCGESELSGDQEAIRKALKRYHAARVRHYIATSDIHRKQHEREQIQKQRKDLMRDKREQVRRELEGGSVSE
eukprot:TRINITY_DN487_c0_g2_i1.p1 TRINITY_DN487_c0_g2~~TRINITY_DN487_c0_g2_i1.p1  ORF type:complete len:459 (+),score=136.95 TRINITY_DN487_c0_g2_i1:67-1377(+)